MQSTAGEGVIERSVRRRVVRGLEKTSSDCTHFGPPTTPVGSTPRENVVVRAPRVVHPSRNIIAPTSTSVSVHHAESSRAGVLWSFSPQSLVAQANIARATVPHKTSAHAVGGASSRQGP